MTHRPVDDTRYGVHHAALQCSCEADNSIAFNAFPPLLLDLQRMLLVES